MESEQFFLKWNNFESNLASGFADLLQTEAMVDVTLAAEGKIIQAHKIILSICSSYFRNMFQVNPCQHPIVVLKDVRYQELIDMLDFMYKGEANVRQQDLPSFLKLAQTLEIKGLAGNQEELSRNSRKRSQSQFSDFSYDLDEPSNEIDKELIYKKKAKGCLSSVLDARNAPHSPNVKQEVERGDNLLRNDMSLNSQDVIIKEERLSDNSLDSCGENLRSESTEIKRAAGPSSVDDNCDIMPQEKVFFQTSDYSFLESCFGGKLLVLNGYSYRRKSVTAERSYWFCCRKKCSAKGILLSDGIFQFSNFEHSHEPEFESIRKKEKLIELKKLALQLNVSGQDLLEALNIKEDVKKHLSFIRTCRRRARRQNPTETSIKVGLDYKRLPSRVNSKEMILHSGYLYRQDSKNPLKDSCKYWKCRLKSCKARAKTDEFGNLTVLKFRHCHQPEEMEISKLSRQSALAVDTFNKDKNKESGSPSKPFQKVKKFTCPEPEEKLKPTIIERSTDLRYSPTATDSDTFNLEKLMAETLADCDTSEFTDTLLKS